jgi:hypothetical protein
MKDPEVVTRDLSPLVIPADLGALEEAVLA